MLVKESLWIRNTIDTYFIERHFPLLNVGSSTDQFRRKIQPYIYANIFEPLKAKGLNVIHTDIKQDEGVDLVGDLNDSEFREKLREQKIGSVLCSNLLEHLINPKMICDSIVDIVKSGDLVVVTVPYFYPYHKDPIDTMFRPTVMDLLTFFPDCELMDSEIVIENDSFKNVLFKNKKYFLIMLLRWLVPFYKYKEWRLSIADLMRWKKSFAVTCILLKKK